jgi:uncharacterized membrane protein YGL010W
MSKEKVMNREPSRAIHQRFIEYTDHHQDPTNRLIQWFCIPLISFSILGLIWAVPVQFHFLGKYKDFANLATIFIGIVMYYYWTLSRILFWAMLFTIGIFSYFIVQLEYWERAGGPAFWLVCIVIFIISLIGKFIGYKFEGKKTSFIRDLKFLLISPLWLWSKLFNKLKIPY